MRKTLLLALGCLFVALSAAKETQPKPFLRGDSASLLPEHAYDGAPPPPRRMRLVAGANLTAWPKAIADTGSVTISWEGVPSPSAKDYITISCGPRASADDVLDKRAVPAGSGSRGKVVFATLYDMRCPYRFDYVQVAASGDASSHSVVATVTVPMEDAPTTPKQRRVAFGDRDDELWVSFTSDSANKPAVRYGLSADALTSVATGTSRTYTAKDMCSAPANVVSQQGFRSPGFHHHVKLSGLKPATEYFYSVGNDIDGWSDVKRVRSKAPAGWDIPAKFIAYGDMGDWEAPGPLTTAQSSLNEVNNGFDSFLVHFGDISYAMGSGFDWDYFGTMTDRIASRTPYMMSIGNHEYCYESNDTSRVDPSGVRFPGWHPSWGNMNTDSRGECAVPMVSRYQSPRNGNGLFWYSFAYGPVSVVSISGEHDWTPGAEQYQWLERQLAAVDRAKTPFLLLTCHRMMYTTQLCEDGDYKLSFHMRAALEPLLVKYKVNAMLVGHQHSYERSCPVRDGKCVPQPPAEPSDALYRTAASIVGETDESGAFPLPRGASADRADGFGDVVRRGTVHLTVGSAGAGPEKCGFSPELGEWSVVGINTYGILRTVATRDKMVMEFIRNKEGDLYDRVVILPWTD